jgi:hypothetical protein
MRTEQEQWDYLVNKTHHASMWTGSWVLHGIRIKETPYRVTLKADFEHFIGYILFSLVIPFGFVFLLVGVLMDDMLLRWRVISVVLGLLHIIGPVPILLRTNSNFGKSICWDKYGSDIIITYGPIFFRKSLRIGREHVEACLYVCEKNVQSTNIRSGYSILSLKRTDRENSEFIIASSEKHSSLKNAFERLSVFTKAEDYDNTLTQIKVIDGMEITIPRTSLSQSRHHGINDRILLFPSTNVAAFKMSFWPYFWGVLCILFGSFFTFCLVVFSIAKEKDITLIIFGLILGPMFLLIGTRELIRLLLYRYIIADKTKNKLLYRSKLTDTDKGKIFCELSDIIAVQVCLYGSYVSTGRTTHDVTIYELNIVLKHAEENRKNIIRSRDGQKVRNYAERFADFLNVPMFDHT